MVQNNDLGSEILHPSGRLVLAVRGHITSLDILDRDVLDIEAYIVTGSSLGKGFMMHLDRLDLSGEVDGGKGHNHAWLYDSCLHSANGNCPDASNFVDILKIRKLSKKKFLNSTAASTFRFFSIWKCLSLKSDPKD